MLSPQAGAVKLCDGLTRREALRVGGLSALGMALPQALAASAADGRSPRSRSCNVLSMTGGPPQHETRGPMHENAFGDPLNRDDPSGLQPYFTHTLVNRAFSWRTDEKSCRITLTVRINAHFSGNWTSAQISRWVLKFREQAEGAFNPEFIRIYGTGSGASCPCRNGWTPTLETVFDSTSSGVLMTVGPTDAQSGVVSDDPMRITATLDWFDVFKRNSELVDTTDPDVPARFRGKTYSQWTAPHEFGHILGLRHPGLAAGFPRGSDPEYWYDAPGLMGIGEEIRPEYFAPWAARLDQQYPDCRSHVPADVS